MQVLNDLYDYDLKIYQDTLNFKFSLDSLLLAEYINVPKNARTLLDLCTGNAPLPLIMAKKTSLNITGVELQPEIYALAKKSVEYNNYQDRIQLLNINAKDTNNYFPGNNFDIITCNPPFFKKNETSLINDNMTKAIARHELTITLPEIIETASYLIKPHGKFYLVHRPNRLSEIIKLASKYQFEAKKITFIYSNLEKDAIMVLFEFVSCAHPGTKVYSKIINRDTKTYQNIFKGR